MAIRDSLFVQAAGPAGLLDVEETRLGLGALVLPHTSNIKAKSGFRPGPSAPGVVTATGTPDAFVHVSQFQLFLQGGRASAPGMYIAAVDATVDINILSTPANPTNPRDDLIIAQQSDTFYGDGTSPFEVKQIVGTPSGSPVDPTVPGSTDYVTLARVRVDALATTIVSGKITDLRTSGHAKSLTGGLYAVGLGGMLPVASTAERGALSGTYNGLCVWRQDSLAAEVYTGTVWQVIPSGLEWGTNGWTPALTNMAVGNGTQVARYRKLGKNIDWYYQLILGTTSTVGTDPSFTLPGVPAAHYSTGALKAFPGTVSLRDEGIGERQGSVRITSGSTVLLQYWTAGPTNQQITATIPWTWGNTDGITAWGSYESLT